MRQTERYTTEKNMVGKTIAQVLHSYTNDEIFIRYTDGTYTIFTAEDDASEGIYVWIPEGDSKLSENLHILLELGVLTAEEYETSVKAAEERRAYEVERRERQELERLKARYESSAPKDGVLPF